MTATLTFALEERLVGELRGLSRRDLSALLTRLLRYHPEIDSVITDLLEEFFWEIDVEAFVRLTEMMSEIFDIQPYDADHTPARAVARRPSVSEGFPAGRPVARHLMDQLARKDIPPPCPRRPPHRSRRPRMSFSLFFPTKFDALDTLKAGRSAATQVAKGRDA